MIFFMKKILGILIISLICNIATAAGKYVGTGELQLQDYDLKVFGQYLRPPAGQAPMMFYIISEDGKAIWSTYWYCPFGNCQTHSKSDAVNKCKMGAEKHYKRTINAECKIFARKRTIVWDNQINPGKGKVSTINSKWSDAEVRAKFTELGFLGGSTSSSTTTKSKITKKVTGNTLDLTKELKELKQLLDEKILTQDEFTQLKKNLLKKYKE